MSCFRISSSDQGKGKGKTKSNRVAASHVDKGDKEFVLASTATGATCAGRDRSGAPLYDASRFERELTKDASCFFTTESGTWSCR